MRRIGQKGPKTYGWKSNFNLKNLKSATSESRLYLETASLAWKWSHIFQIDEFPKDLIMVVLERTQISSLQGAVENVKVRALTVRPDVFTQLSLELKRFLLGSAQKKFRYR